MTLAAEGAVQVQVPPASPGGASGVVNTQLSVSPELTFVAQRLPSSTPRSALNTRFAGELASQDRYSYGCRDTGRVAYTRRRQNFASQIAVATAGRGTGRGGKWPRITLQANCPVRAGQRQSRSIGKRG